MKKILQRFNVTVQGTTNSGNDEGVLLFTNTLRDDYSNVTGVFLVIESGSANALFIRLNIGNIEILPKEVSASLITYNGNFSLKDATYDFSADKIPARSSSFEVEFTNHNADDVVLSLYFVLENL